MRDFTSKNYCTFFLIRVTDKLKMFQIETPKEIMRDFFPGPTALAVSLSDSQESRFTSAAHLSQCHWPCQKWEGEEKETFRSSNSRRW
jgi:hypothetical protein